MTVTVYQQLVRPEPLFGHLFARDPGFLVTFTGKQARFLNPEAPKNELSGTRQRSWPYPEKVEEAADYLIAQAQLERDCYFGVHLFREAGNRRAANAAATVRSLWLDEDEGRLPDKGPEPTAIVRSSGARRHLYWRLSHPVAVEWAVAMNRRLAAWAGGDMGKAGAASVLRAPGTANYKRPPRVDLVVGEFTGAPPWEPGVLDQAVPEIPEPSPSAREPYDGPELDLAPYLENGDRTGTRLGQRRNGALWFHCDHAHCLGRTWTDFILAVGGRAVKVSRPTGNLNNERTVKITRE